MSESQIIFIEGDLIPSIEMVIKEESKRDYGVKFESWECSSTQEVAGYWPCKLNNDCDSGFEFSLEVLEESDIDDFEVDKNILKNKTHYVELTYRDQYEYKCAIALSAIFCKHCNGITFNENNELKIISKNSVKWAKKILKSNIATIKQYETIHIYGRNSKFERELNEIIGKEIKEVIFLGVYAGGICITFESGCSLFSSAWKYIGLNKLIDATKYRKIYENEMEYKHKINLFSRSSELTIEEETNLNEYEKNIELAFESDEKEINKFKKEILNWPDKLTISDIKWDTKDKIAIFLNEVEESMIELIVIGELQEIKFKTSGEYEYHIHKSHNK